MRYWVALLGPDRWSRVLAFDGQHFRKHINEKCICEDEFDCRVLVHRLWSGEGLRHLYPTARAFSFTVYHNSGIPLDPDDYMDIREFRRACALGFERALSRDRARQKFHNLPKELYASA